MAIASNSGKLVGALALRHTLLLLIFLFVQFPALATELLPHSTTLSIKGLAEHITPPYSYATSHRLQTTQEHQPIRTVHLKARIRGQGLIHARLSIKRNLTRARSFTINGQNVPDTTTPTLLQGVVSIGGSFGKKSKGRLTPTALSVINNKVRLTFFGRPISSTNRRRLYSLHASLGESSEVKARISSLPATGLEHGSCDSHDESSHSHPDSRIASLEHNASTSLAAVTTKIATLSTDADPEWFELYGEQSNAEIARIINAAEAIFLRDFGVRFRIVKQHTYTERSPYSSTRAEFLLSQFANNGKNSENLADTPEEYASNVDLKHLFTGKNLEGSTVGIAYIGTVCVVPQRAFGITQAVLYDATVGVFAHEISHNLGASHDQNASGTIMYPSISIPPANQFSAFSREQINSFLVSGSRCFETSSEQEPIPDDSLDEAPGLEDPELDPDLSLRLWQRKRQITSRSPIRLGGELIDSTGLPVEDRIIELQLKDGTIVAATSTNENGRFSFSIPPRSFRKRRIALFAATEERDATSDEIRITLLKDSSNRLR